MLYMIAMIYMDLRDRKYCDLKRLTPNVVLFCVWIWTKDSKVIIGEIYNGQSALGMLEHAIINF